MKIFNVLLVFFVLMGACKGQNQQKEEDGTSTKEPSYASFGKEVSPKGTIAMATISEKYKTLQLADTLATKFTAQVTEVCQSKGCWMKLQLENGDEAMVRFKDYGFFVPKDLTGKEVIVNGLAYVGEMSVEEQRHYAEDGGKSEEEIAQITAPKRTYGFLADGVLVKQ
ncbi:MAG: DUF4920 domain-containing protein [Flavobacteriaceae bacterium]